jgi:alpha-glucoside transport system permease protein
MTTATDEPTTPGASTASGSAASAVALRLAGVLAIVAIAWLTVAWAVDFLRDRDANRLAIVAVALVIGVFGVFGVFWAMDQAVDAMPGRVRETVRPYVFVGPALVLLSIFLIYPVVNTVLISFRDGNSRDWVGLDNYEFVFSNDNMLRSIRNSAMWIVLVPLVAVTIGLVFATLADRLRRGEAIAKSLIFLPMAISFVGAAVTFRLIYSFRPEGFGSNIGLLNGIKDWLGQDPVAWLDQRPWNNFMLMAIMVWMQTGFAMVVLSAAIKSIPDEILEAARIDGASELQVFRKITIPSILPTVVVVTTYMVINSLKVFDIVFVMTNAETTGTEVIAERMIRWSFLLQHNGRGAAIAVVLFLAVIPVMVWNVRKFREEEAIR